MMADCGSTESLVSVPRHSNSRKGPHRRRTRQMEATDMQAKKMYGDIMYLYMFEIAKQS